MKDLISLVLIVYGFIFLNLLLIYLIFRLNPKTTNFYATKPLSSQREESTKLHKRTL
jgi:hypothetical protein